ncbi:hypothetical protein SAMN05444161_4673 [Rhizobiales bacterium GAS191]|nr:hypothetical protein SAMN05444161_4673 [Rhizobiales bacterium GAS191]
MNWPLFYLFIGPVLLALVVGGGIVLMDTLVERRFSGPRRADDEILKGMRAERSKLLTAIQRCEEFLKSDRG